MSGRKIGDEYQYILERKYASQFPGNMLERPSLLINPWKVRDTNNLQERLQSGDQFAADGVESDRGRNNAMQKRQGVASYEDISNLDFLANSSLIVSNLTPDENGQIAFDTELLKNKQHIRIVVNDAYSTVSRNFNRQLQPRQSRDLRLASIMDPQKNFSKSRKVEVIKANEPFVVEDIVSAKFQKYDDLKDVFQFFLTKNSELSKFKFIVAWPTLSPVEKRELYSEFACHELNFFLYHKDRKFFDEVIRQHIGFKRDSTFLDRWLLKKDLTDFAGSRQFQCLNTAERILLSRRLEDARREIVRNITDQDAMLPPNRARFGRLFDEALGSVDFDDSNESLARKFEELKLDSESTYRNRLNKKTQLGYLGQIDRKNTPMPKESASKLVLGGRAGGGGGFGGGGASRGRALTKSKKGLARLVQPQIARKPVDRMEFQNSTGLKIMVAELGELTRDESENGVLADGNINGKAIAESRKELEPFYRRIKKTSEHIENNYWKIRPDQETPKLVPVNRFWKDYALHEGGDFLSPYFAEANSSLTEIMFALSVLDLPFEAAPPEMKFVDSQMTLTPSNDIIVLHQQVQSAAMDRGNTAILVSENFFEKQDRYRTENGVRFDKFISDDFLVQTLYGGQVVVTNPTSTPRMIDVLFQLPQGAVFAGNSQETHTIQKQLNAFSTQTYEYYFYFPAAGQFDHFPAHVSVAEKVLAVANPHGFNVIDRPKQLDKTSWQYVSQNGSDQDVIDFLNKQNILSLDLEKIAFRMKDQDFFQKATRALRNRFVFHRTLWSYSVQHNDPVALKEFLANESVVIKACQPIFQSNLLDINPVDRKWYYHREYRPLVNARTHQVGKVRTILNPAFRSTYLMFMNALCHKPELSIDDHLAITYFMLLQDRIDDAMAHFAKVDPEQLNSRMQYDYCDAYLDMYRMKPDDAARKAERWVSYPVEHWNKRFKNIIAQVEEIRGGTTQATDKKDSSQSQTLAASKSESFEFDVDQRTVTLKYQNVKKVTVNYYQRTSSCSSHENHLLKMTWLGSH